MYTLIGIVGAALILLGFYRISIGKWTGKSFWYELDNLVGALLVMVYQLHHKAYVTTVVNIVWAIVAVRGLSSYRERRKRKNT
jgi:uncharacterized membrane protein